MSFSNHLQEKTSLKAIGDNLSTIKKQLEDAKKAADQILKTHEEVLISIMNNIFGELDIDGEYLFAEFGDNHVCIHIKTTGQISESKLEEACTQHGCTLNRNAHSSTYGSYILLPHNERCYTPIEISIPF